MRRPKLFGGMRRSALTINLLIWASAVSQGVRVVIDDERIVQRGDANGDRRLNISDVVFILSHLYQGGPEAPCFNQEDVNGDGQVSPRDPLFLLHWLFIADSGPRSRGLFEESCVEGPGP